VTVFAVIKDPAANKDYVINWADPAAPGGSFLTGGDTLAASTWTVYQTTNSGLQPLVSVPPGIVVGSSSFTTTTTTVWFTGGVAGTEYLAVNHITTAQTRQEDQSIIILCTNQ
jgi:hypothetical protein